MLLSQPPGETGDLVVVMSSAQLEEPRPPSSSSEIKLQLIACRLTVNFIPYPDVVNRPRGADVLL